MSASQLSNRAAERMCRMDVRMTPTDRAHVHRAARALGLRPSQYVRAAALDALADNREGSSPRLAVTVTRIAEDDRAAILAAQLDLRRVGTNLNQLTRLANLGQVDLAQLGLVVAELAAAVEDLATQLGAHR